MTPYSWHCSGTLITTVLSEDCTVSTFINSSGSTSTSPIPDISATSTAPISAFDFYFFAVLVIFFLAVPFFRYIFANSFFSK